MTAPHESRLPCGRDPETLLAYAADRVRPSPSSHAASCPYCQTTIDEYRQLWEPVRRWATRDTAMPPDFVRSVMRRVRRIVQSPRHAATISEQGITTVTSWVLGLIASAATLETPDVASITGTPDYGNKAAADRYGADGIEITETGATDIAVTLGITATGSSDLPALAETVRRKIMSAITEQTGIAATEIDIRIDDIDL